jgi:uncharacterized damage-inducible protein DinB
MAIRDAILPEFDNEMKTTRKTLERVPEGKGDWKPHEKSMTLGRLAGHMAELPTFATRALTSDSFDVRPASGAPPRQPLVMTSRQQLLEAFDTNVVAAREAISKASDEDFMKPWSVLAGGKPMMTMPKVAVVRTFTLSHLIHHRGQLSVYLRLNNEPVPSIYGPSADENPFQM